MPLFTIQVLAEDRWRTHASAVRLVDGRGVLITGVPGVGKTAQLAMFLSQAAMLISDDYLDLARIDGQLYASPPPNIAGVLALRGQPMVRVPYAAPVHISHHIALSDYSDSLADHTGITLASMASEPADYQQAEAFVTACVAQGAALTHDWLPQNIRVA